MAKRTTITTQEEAKLLRAFLESKDWEVAKSFLPDVSPAALDKGWKAWAYKKAGIEPAPPAPPVVEKKVEPPPVVKGEQKKIDPLR